MDRQLHKARTDWPSHALPGTLLSAVSAITLSGSLVPLALLTYGHPCSRWPSLMPSTAPQTSRGPSAWTALGATRGGSPRRRSSPRLLVSDVAGSHRATLARLYASFSASGLGFSSARVSVSPFCGAVAPRGLIEVMVLAPSPSPVLAIDRLALLAVRVRLGASVGAEKPLRLGKQM